MTLTNILLPRQVNIFERERPINRPGAREDKKLVIIHGQACLGKSMLAAQRAQNISTDRRRPATGERAPPAYGAESEAKEYV